MATITYTVTVASGTTQYGTGNRFYINGELAPVLYLQEGNTYIFDQSDSSNAVGGVHQIAFSRNANNDPTASYTSGVTSTGKSLEIYFAVYRTGYTSYPYLLKISVPEIGLF